MGVGIQIAVYTMWVVNVTRTRKNFMGKHCKCMASYTNIWIGQTLQMHGFLYNWAYL